VVAEVFEFDLDAGRAPESIVAPPLNEPPPSPIAPPGACVLTPVRGFREAQGARACDRTNDAGPAVADPARIQKGTRYPGPRRSLHIKGPT
jgi:hypothetical protein